MRKFKQLVSGVFMSLVLFTSIPLISYAGGFNASINAGGGGSSGGTGQTVGSGNSHLTSDTAGVRITLIDPNTGQPVSKSVDILWSAPPNNVARFTKARSEDVLSGDTNNWLWYSVPEIEQLLSKAGYKTEVPRWYSRASGNVHTGDGKPFRDWFCSQQAMDYLAGVLDNMKAIENADDKVKEKNEELNEQIDDAFQNKGGLSGSEADRISNEFQESKTQGKCDVKNISPSMYESMENYIKSRQDTPLTTSYRFKNWVHLYMTTPTYYEAISKEEFLGKATEFRDLFNSVVPNSDNAKTKALEEFNDCIRWINNFSPTLVGKINEEKSLLDLFTITSFASSQGSSTNGPNGMKLDDVTPDKNWSGNSSSSNLDSAGRNVELYVPGTDRFDVTKTGYCLPLLGLKDNGVSIFAQDGKTAKDVVDMFLNGEAHICVEPILFFVPQGRKNYVSYFYGTPAAYGRFSVEVLMPWDPVTGSGGDIFRGPNVAFIMAFDLSDDEEKLADSYKRVAFLKDTPYKKGGIAPTTNGGYKTPRYRGEVISSFVTDKVGMGMHLYALPGNGSSSSINTYNIVDHPTSDDNAEPTTGKPDESEEYKKKNKNKTFQIAKFYRVKVGDTYYEWSYYSKKNTPHTIQITDEAEIGWKLTDWFTSTSDWLPPDGGDPAKYPWEEYVKANNPVTTYSGTEEKLLVVKPDDPDKTLYLLYERQMPEEPEPETVTVIRVYDDEEGNPEKIEREEISGGPGEYPVPIDPEYKYVETKESPNPPKEVDDWSDSEGDPKGTPPTVKYPETTKTIYIHYVKPPKAPDTQKIVLYENELSYNYDLRDLLKDRKLLKIYEYVPAPEVDYGPCTGPHHDRCSHGSPNHYCNPYTCSDDDYTLTDNTYSFTVADSFDQNTLPFIKQWTYTSKMSASGLSPKEGGGGERYPVTPQATFLLIRDKQKDVVTLYPGKNDSIKGEISDLGLSESYTSTDTRYKNKRETNATEKFFDTVYTKLYYSDREDELAWLSWMSPKRHSRPGTYNTEPQIGHTPDDANAAYSKTDNVEIRYFLGQAGKSEEEPKDTRSAWSKKFKYNTAYSRVSAGLSFYPYLKYEYYRKDSSSPEPVMVTSSNLSELKVYNAIQTGVYKKNEININLDSTQWSTHARSMAFLKNAGISDKKSVLPGGAIQNLDSGHKGDTQIGLTIWQTCLPDTQVQAVQEGFKVSETEAKEATNNLIESVKKAISGYGLVQWGQQGVYGDMKELMEVAEELHENKGISFVAGRGGKTSADDKYYLRHDGDGSNRANFDCLDSRIENQYLYTIYSDVDGNVWVTKDGAELARISKTENADKLLSNAELKLLDDNTKLITNYTAVIQRNSGTTRHGDKWHNEAFDGVSVLMTDVSFDVGYGGDAAKRTNVLDPLLTAPTQSKSDLYNFTEDLVRSSVYVTTKTSSQAEDTSKEGFLGILKGVSGMPDLETGLTDIQSMCYTKNFYIPNATVSDLN